MELLPFTITLVKSIIPSLLAFLMFFQKIPDMVELKNYKISLKVIAVAYLCLGIANVMHLFAEERSQTEISSLVSAGIYVIVSALQALLFTFSLITLIDTYYVTRKRLITQLVPIALLGALTIAGFVWKNQLYLQTVIYIFAAYYFGLLIYYTFIYVSEEKKLKANMQDFFSDDESKRIAWVRIAFFSSLIIGIWVLFVILFPKVTIIELTFSCTCMIFYPYLAFRYMNYTHDFYVLQPVVIPEEEKEPELPLPFPTTANRIDFTQAIEEWVNNKSFIKPGITIKELANELNTNRTYLSNYINTNKKATFCQWLNDLRIEEAQRILRNDPNISLKDIAQDLGYKEQATFSKQFTNITGLSPSEWRKRTHI